MFRKTALTLLFYVILSVDAAAAPLDYQFFENSMRVLEQSTFDEIPVEAYLRIAAYNGIGGNAPVGIETSRPTDAEHGLAFYMAGFSVYVYAQGDRSTYEAVERRISASSSHPAKIWASEFLLNKDLRTLDPAGQLKILIDASDNPATISSTIMGHRAAALLLVNKSERDVDAYLSRIFSGVTNDKYGLAIGMEYVNVFKVFKKPKLFNSAFLTLQKNYQDSPRWDNFVPAINLLDYIILNDIDDKLFHRGFIRIKDFQKQLDVLSLGAQYSIAICDQARLNWFLEKIHQWRQSFENKLPEKEKLTATVTALGEIEAVYTGITNVTFSPCLQQ